MRTIIWLILTIANLIFGLIIFGLLFRFILKMFAADPSAQFTRIVYNNTQALISPFQGIFNPLAFGVNGIIELHTLIAMVVYILFAFLVTEIFLNIKNAIPNEPNRNNQNSA